MSKYENGYFPKIEYWTGKLNAEVFNTKNPNLEEIMYIMSKLDYFVKRENNTKVGSMVDLIAGVDFSQSLSQLRKLGNELSL